MTEAEISNLPRIGAARKLAQKVLSDCQILDIPIVLNQLFLKIRQIHPILVIGKDLGEKTSGFQVSYEDQVAIIFNVNHSTHRNRFTVAHELGHYLLGHTTNSKDYFSLTRNKENEEIEANEFARELLVPTQNLKKEFGKTPNIHELSTKFNISKEVISIQLIKHKMV